MAIFGWDLAHQPPVFSSDGLFNIKLVSFTVQRRQSGLPGQQVLGISVLLTKIFFVFPTSVLSFHYEGALFPWAGRRCGKKFPTRQLAAGSGAGRGWPGRPCGLTVLTIMPGLTSSPATANFL